jgi:hypothetical protein
MDSSLLAGDLVISDPADTGSAGLKKFVEGVRCTIKDPCNFSRWVVDRCRLHNETRGTSKHLAKSANTLEMLFWGAFETNYPPKCKPEIQGGKWVSHSRSVALEDEAIPLNL